VSEVDDKHEEAIASSWRSNALAWARAVREGEIASRVELTNRAVLDTIMACAPRKVLDVGCGEGWLLRALAEKGVQGYGFDESDALVSLASAAGGAQYWCQSYLDFAALGPLHAEKLGEVDVAVCNFSLIGKEPVEKMLAALPGWLTAHGTLIIQTLHPAFAAGEEGYRDGWRAGSWVGCGEGFNEPAPWYYRTLASLHALLQESGFRLLSLQEPQFPDAATPASLILVAGLTNT
jgi:2-polyprenyl-3-methyl-5-hydroxy-6-metoxy-1,4-benzoquinol methylase